VNDVNDVNEAKDLNVNDMNDENDVRENIRGLCVCLREGVCACCV